MGENRRGPSLDEEILFGKLDGEEVVVQPASAWKRVWRFVARRLRRQ